MKEGWKMVKLEEVCEIFGRIGFRGYTTKDLVESPHEGAISLSPSNIVDGRMDYSKCTYISWYKYNESPEIMIFNGDILLVKTGSSYGKSALVEGLPHKATINPQSVVLKNFKINNKFLAYQIRTKRIKDEFDKFVSGTAIPTFSQAKLSEVQIFCPPLEEQHRIVSILDAAFAKIDALKKNAEENLKNAKALFQQVLAQELQPKEGWVEKKLSEIGDIQTGTTPDTKDKTNFGNFIPFVKPADVNYDGLGGLNYNNEGLSESGVSQSRLIKGKSVLMVCIGATISKTGYNICDVTCNQQINTLTPYNDDYKYCYYAMIAPSFKYEILKEGNSHQTTLPIINKKKWSNLIISLPPLEEQHRIVQTLDTLSEKCRRLEQIAQQTIRECDALKQSILRRAFSGEL